MSDESTATDRDRRSRPGLDQTSPHATRVMKSWKSAVSSVVFAIARSTWASDRTVRRTAMPCSYRASSVSPSPSGLVMNGSFQVVAVGPVDAVEELPQHRGGGFGVVGGRQVRGISQADRPTVLDAFG